MPRVAPRVPESNELLCEGCGYVLNGLPDNSRCPECGKPIVESIGNHRTAPAWEQHIKGAAGFCKTTSRVIFSPTRFYRTLDVRGSVESARRFARWHCALAAVLFSLAAAGHAWWYLHNIYSVRTPSNTLSYAMAGVAVILLASLCYVGLFAITRLAARLTNWEATYRGIRLPVIVVLRGLYYHAAHYLPVSAAAAVTVIGYQWLLIHGTASIASATTYLYVLSGLVVVSAIYLFNTYWIGMRNMMYANR